MERVRAELPPVFEMVTPMPFGALQQLLDETNAWGFHVYEKATYVAELTDPVVDVLAAHGHRKNSPQSIVLLERLDGAYSRVADSDTAFGGGRSPRYSVAIAPDPALLALDRDWVRELWGALRPHVRAARPDQARVRPREPLPPERRHQAGVATSGMRGAGRRIVGA